MTADNPERMYLHTINWSGYYAFPVDVLSRGKTYAKVRLCHETHIGRTQYPAGTEKHRVPVSSLSQRPSSMALVSQGGGRFK